MNKTINDILTRVSCRSYSSKKVNNKKLNLILEAGKYAPSGKNAQICNIVVLNKKSIVERMRKLSIANYDRDCFYGAKTLVVVYGPKDNIFSYKDGSCILENMFVAANALKVDSCWINQVDDLLNSNKDKKMRKLIGINEDSVVVGTCIFGYRSDDAKLEIKARKEDFVKII